MQADARSNSTVRFGPFHVELKTGELRKNGTKIRVQDLPFRILAVLLERPGELVTREELVEKLWPDGTFVEFEHSLNTAVNKLRTALGDTAGHPRYIETVPRRGYRFVGTVEPRPVEDSGFWTRRKILVAVAAGVAIVVLTGIIPTRTPDPPQASEAVQFTVSLPAGVRFQPMYNRGRISVSPDGRKLAVVGSPEGVRGIWIRPLDSVEARMLEGTKEGGRPFWSPDSRYVGFFSKGFVRRVSVEGGPVQTLCQIPDGQHGSGGSWAADPDGSGDVILFSSAGRNPIYRIPASGGEPVPVTVPGPDRAQRYPSFLPDGRHFLYVDHLQKKTLVGTIEPRDAWAGNDPELAQGAETNLLYAAPAGDERTGHLLFVRNGTLHAVRFDAERREVLGDPFVLAEKIEAARDIMLGNFSVSGNGVLAYRKSPGIVPETELAWLDRGGREIEITGISANFLNLDLSPDGQRAVGGVVNLPGKNHLWVFDLSSGTGQMLTSAEAHDKAPVWTSDGRRVVFGRGAGTGRTDLYIRDARAGAEEELLLDCDGHCFPSSWSRDGSLLVYSQSYDVWVLPMSGEKEPFPYLQSRDRELNAQLSPDGWWMAYESDETGNKEIYIQAFPTPGRRWRISTDGGANPRWRSDGGELYYLRHGRTLMAVRTRTGATFEHDTPEALFDAPIPPSFIGLAYPYDVSAAGQHFLVRYEREEQPVHVTLNWQMLRKEP